MPEQQTSSNSINAAALAEAKRQLSSSGGIARAQAYTREELGEFMRKGWQTRKRRERRERLERIAKEKGK